ncbi:MAG: TonB-dependent siderophore myxochelin receptor MxcH [Myxococcota bacterium]
MSRTLIVTVLGLIPQGLFAQEPKPDSDDSSEAEVIVVEGQSGAQTLEDSAAAVNVIRTARDKKKSADLGEVLARTQGISVRRSGGLGSPERISLNGLTDEQIRFFIDGVPLAFAGYPFGVANVPVNLIERVEVYRGVVPVAFGADALGGAINLVSNIAEGTRSNASYQIGSFGTHRVTADSQLYNDRTGLFARATAFYDRTDNDFEIDVEVPNARGQQVAAQVDRFHDGYNALGVNLEAGVLERAWADRLSLKAFYTDLDRDIQNNVVMTVPFGEPTFAQRSVGLNLQYQNRFDDRLEFDAVVGYSRERREFLDVGECVYTWFGECGQARPQPGELTGAPIDRVFDDDNLYARLNTELQIGERQSVRISLSPTFTTRDGDDRTITDPRASDPFRSRRNLFATVAGAEHEIDLFDDRLANIVFVKGYLQAIRSEEQLVGGTFARRDRESVRGGLGNSLRYRATRWLTVKASYEWATRLPRPEEVFGNGALIADNLELEPETSHNVNLGGSAEFETGVGAFAVQVDGFLRETDNLITLIGAIDDASFENVFAARSLGIEGAASWTSPGDYLYLGGNGTYFDLTNRSGEGAFGAFEGDRIPNRPYLLANGFARLQFSDVMRERDTVALDWNTRFVGEFFRNWESVGLREFKDTIDSQLQHSATLLYTTYLQRAEVSFSAEVQNITDENLFDFFGVQRPGRTLFFKTTLEI